MLAPQTEGLYPGPFFDFCFQSRQMYPSFVEEVIQLSGIDPQYRSEGTLFVMMEGETHADCDHWVEWQTKAGLALERLEANEVLKMEPALTKSTSGGVFLPDDHQIDNRLLMDALSIAARRAGVELIEGVEVESIIVQKGRATGVKAGGEQIESGVVVAAAGSWSTSLLGTAGIELNIVPVRGQMLALRSESPLIRHVLHSNNCYIPPRLDGRILVGATVEHVGFRKAITAKAINSLLDAAIKLVPALESCEIVETWSGLRPDAPDHLPVIGFCDVENLVLATGHYRNGILLAPLTAILVAETILNGREPQELKPFRAERLYTVSSM
jgi:glycine oxidase